MMPDQTEPKGQVSVRGSVRKTAEFIALSAVMGGDIHYRRWPDNGPFLTTRRKPVTKRRGRRW